MTNDDSIEAMGEAAGLNAAAMAALQEAYLADQARRAELARAKPVDSPPVVIGGSGFPGSMTETAG